MGLMDKAKGFLKDHEAQIQEAMDKGKSAVNKVAGGGNPNMAPTSPGAPVPNPAATDQPAPVPDTAATEEETESVQAPPAPSSPPPAASAPPPPPGPPMPGSTPGT